MKVHKLSSLNPGKAMVVMNDEKESLKDREKAISAIVHEVRNPLTAIKLTNQLMQEAFERKKKDEWLLQSYLTIIANNITRIEDQLTDALTYKKREIALKPVNICDCIDKAVCEAKDRLFLGGVTVNHNYQGCHWVYGDETKLVTAFLNIIINAIEAIKTEKGRIWISVYEANNTVRITFKDDGSGMETGTVEKMFDPDFSTKDGIGIGLSHVKEIMKIHKAHIVADSLPGIGTSISILFTGIPDKEIRTPGERASGPVSKDQNH